MIENPRAANKNEPIRDEMLTRGKVPMTKEEVRWVSVNRLTVRPTDTVWDVGAGTGAVTLELARKASDGTVYAVERKSEAVALLRENRTKLGGYNVKIVEGFAPEALEDLPAPDCVFAAAAGRSSRLPAITSASSRHRNFLLFFMVLCTFLSGAPQRASIF